MQFFFAAVLSLFFFILQSFFMLELVMKKYVASCEGKCKKKSSQEYLDNVNLIYFFIMLNWLVYKLLGWKWGGVQKSFV
ncbi:hypothetical protein DXB65_15860 [Bacteroides oleiciplenus]|uniref:Uncharacterized protein n=1 Tax=Bacteroides oleiciplenus TaxID=626931 RepID=A0A3E5B8R5_9BACE|nr:hypothetical protein DXB65_15860 [Bacteroides oleiciplenus]